MDSIARNYPSSGSDTDSDERDDQFEPPLSRLPFEVIEKYKLEPNTWKHEIMSTGGVSTSAQRWCTFLYYEWRPDRLERANLLRIVSRFNDFCKNGEVGLVKQLHFEPLCLSHLGAPLSLHVSLSQAINFEREADRDLLYAKLNEKIRNNRQLGSFTMKFQSSLKLMPSYGKNTLFLTLPVDPVLKSKQMSLINTVIQEAARQTFPTKTRQEIQELTCMPATTHMSIAMTTNVARSVIQNLHYIPPLLPLSQADADFEFPVSSLRFDKNRQILSIPLD